MNQCCDKDYCNNESQLVSDKESQLEFFLASVEKRAYRTALFTTKKTQDALDILQDAMLQLVKYYRDKSVGEWPLLFQRILQNRIMDWLREEQKKKRFFWQSTGLSIDEDKDFSDVLENIVDSNQKDPLDLIANIQTAERLVNVIDQLPLRQRQAFLLRAWEGFDVEQTAQAMECSAGSVKTHYFRAVQKLQELLG